jgi:transposase
VNYLISKEAAAELGMHPKTFGRWMKKLKRRPTLPARPAHQWSRPDLKKFKQAIDNWWKEHDSLYA